MASADLSAAETEAVMEVLQSGRLSMGPKTEAFERATADYCGAKYGVAVSSGTAGLHLLCLAAGVKPGDEVITSSFSFVASTNCILYCGARPVFVDIEPHTYCMDPERIESAITKATKAIIAVDVFGHPADWDPIVAIAERHGLAVIADACESLGSTYRGRPTGPFGIGGVFAYFPNNQVTTGEGGMIVTDDDAVYRVCKSLRNQGRDEGDSWMGHSRLGYNYRMDELSAAVGLAQMSRIHQLLERRSRVAGWYTEVLSRDDRIKTPSVARYAKMSHFVYVIELLSSHEREAVMASLEQRGIQTRGYFAPIHKQKYIADLFGAQQPSLPVTERIAKKTVALPFHNRLSKADTEFVAAELSAVLDQLS